MSKVEDMFDEMLEAQCEQLAKEKEEENDTETKEETKNILKKFLAYIKSMRFNRRCKLTAKKHSLNYKIVKNQFIYNILRKIADILHLTITITVEVVNYAADFIAGIINKVTYFCKDVCIRITTLLTLNCGSYIEEEC